MLLNSAELKLARSVSTDGNRISFLCKNSFLHQSAVIVISAGDNKLNNVQFDVSAVSISS